MPPFTDEQIEDFLLGYMMARLTQPDELRRRATIYHRLADRIEYAAEGHQDHLTGSATQ